MAGPQKPKLDVPTARECVALATFVAFLVGARIALTGPIPEYVLCLIPVPPVWALTWWRGRKTRVWLLGWAPAGGFLWVTSLTSAASLYGLSVGGDHPPVTWVLLTAAMLASLSWAPVRKPDVGACVILFVYLFLSVCLTALGVLHLIPGAPSYAGFVVLEVFVQVYLTLALLLTLIRGRNAVVPIFGMDVEVGEILVTTLVWAFCALCTPWPPILLPLVNSLFCSPMGVAALIFFGISLYTLLLCWGRQWNVLALLIFVELSWVSLAGGFGLLSLFLLDVMWLYLTALVAVLSGVELVLSLFAFTTWHRGTGQTFLTTRSGRLR